MTRQEIEESHKCRPCFSFNLGHNQITEDDYREHVKGHGPFWGSPTFAGGYVRIENNEGKIASNVNVVQCMFEMMLDLM